MATIRPNDLPAAGSVGSGNAIIIDDGATVEKATPAQVVDAAIPLASQAEAEAGTDNTKRVTPLRVSQAIDALGVSAAALASTDSDKGAALSHIQRDTVDRTVRDLLLDNLPHAFDAIPATEHAAILAGTSTYDATADLQRLIDSDNGFRLPDGVIRIDATTGLVVKTGTIIIGNGPNRSCLYALSGGATLANLAAYNGGSVIRRDFDPAGANIYVSGVLVKDFAVVLNHPDASVTTTEIQIGFDFRNISRSNIEGCWVGNIAPPQGVLTKARPADTTFEIQGYGVVFGNVSASDPAYAGGEVNVVQGTKVWGVFKAVATDDVDLSPSSASYQPTILGNDIQSCHHAIVQYGQFGARAKVSGNTIQNIKKQNGNVTTSYVYRFDGFENVVDGTGYMELGTAGDVVVYCGSSSRGNRINIPGFTSKNTSVTVVSDNGTNNLIEWGSDAALVSGVVDSRGTPQISFNRVLSPGSFASYTISANGEALPSSFEHLTVNGSGRTGITVTAGRFRGQKLRITANSAAFIFAASGSGVVWGEGGPPRMGNAAKDVMSVDLVNTVSGWFEVSRTYRASATAITDASGGATVDAEARTALNALLQVMRDRGVIGP
ncbi:MAG: hypothetical protein GOVbin7759_3 [Prokaryotic dsDNA virus sp.]|jgi:hypothetical protein|nr:MAG: hypothetical protein GOVbin7759_3 [Prokaryotic dsDNA virus sp.]|tara:strand:- start:1354 stop:3174 length:1821 start_codon:yes stop_codon:yes gene_type:complete